MDRICTHIYTQMWSLDLMNSLVSTVTQSHRFQSELTFQARSGGFACSCAHCTLQNIAPQCRRGRTHDSIRRDRLRAARHPTLSTNQITGSRHPDKTGLISRPLWHPAILLGQIPASLRELVSRFPAPVHRVHTVAAPQASDQTVPPSADD